MSHNRNGQLFASDLLASLVVFFFIVNLSLVVWNMAYENKTRFDDSRQLRERVVRSSDILVRTQGYPNGWNESTVELVGFVKEDHVLDNEKLRDFNKTAYIDQKNAVRASPSEFYLTVTSDGSIINLSEAGKPDLLLEYGSAVSTDAQTVATNERSVLINNSNKLTRGTLKLVFWE